RLAQLDAVDLGHADVEQRRVEVELAGALEHGPRRAVHGGLEALELEQLPEVLGEVAVVVDDEDAPAHRPSTTIGRTARTSAPPSVRFLASIVPPCFSTMRAQSASPSPMPLEREVTSGSKIRASTSAWNPGPSSRTSIHAWPSSIPAATSTWP